VAKIIPEKVRVVKLKEKKAAILILTNLGATTESCPYNIRQIIVNFVGF
jgi:hypothetical protein